jgi:class 3 adenylate cyclase
LSRLSHSAGEAVALYHDDFLTGFTLPDSPDFDDWQLFQAEALRQELADTLERLVQGYAAQEAYKPALAYARRWLALNPLHEPAQRRLMQLYVQAGDPAAALRQYQECVRVLKRELGVSPSVETTSLYERVRQGMEERGSRVAAPPGDFAQEQRSRGRKELEGTQGNLNPSDALIQTSIGADQRSPVPGLQPAASEETTGASLSALEDKMRLVTILCADMSHAVETMWPDQPEETADLMKHLLTTMEQILGKYQARVDRFLGNGLLAVFGAPQLHEDDPERAIRAALEIRAVAQELGLGVSMGINTGVVYFGRLDAEAHQDITVMGPVVNLAARLQAQAEAGQILVGTATYRHTQRAFRFSPLLLTSKEAASRLRLIKWLVYAVGQRSSMAWKSCEQN